MSDASYRRPRARGRGKWSGAEKKHEFLLACLCDDNLANRIEELRSISPWWAWLSPQTLTEQEQDKVQYLCPTYVLYDALSSSGRGEWDTCELSPHGPHPCRLPVSELNFFFAECI